MCRHQHGVMQIIRQLQAKGWTIYAISNHPFMLLWTCMQVHFSLNLRPKYIRGVKITANNLCVQLMVHLNDLIDIKC